MLCQPRHFPSRHLSPIPDHVGSWTNFGPLSLSCYVGCWLVIAMRAPVLRACRFLSHRLAQALSSLLMFLAALVPN